MDAAEIVTFSTVWFGASRNTQEEIDSFQTQDLFTGQKKDFATLGSELYYYNARYYDPQIGRFISADTVVQDYSSPQSLNRYSYCLNNPLKYNDPSGHVAIPVAIITVGTIIFVVIVIEAYVSQPENTKDLSEAINEGIDDLKERANNIKEKIKEGFSWVKDKVEGWLGSSTDPNNMTNEELSDKGKEIDPAGGGEETKAGRAFRKHSAQSRPGGAYPEAKGTPEEINEQGQKILDDILTNPGSTRTQLGRGGLEVRSPDGRGVRYNSDGSLSGFIE